jgi:regulator of sirC expression with transglutaminase-like and TPR domain
VDTPPHPLENRDACLRLLDDPSPVTRHALLSYFAAHPEASRHFLLTLIENGHRLLASHARSYLEELRFTNPAETFRDFIRSLNYELETGALLLARTVYPQLDVGPCCTHLDRLAARCRELIAEPMGAREKCRVINRVLFHEEGFRGNLEHYTDPLNSFLPEVLERRKGIPISLCLVYLLVAHRLGLTLEPVGLPGHFVIGCFTEETPFFIDAFEKGAFRTPLDLFAFLKANHLSPTVHDLAPTPVREVLCRTCRNLVHHFTVSGDDSHARLFAGFVEEFESTHERHAQP